MVLALGHLAWVATRMRLSDGVDPSLRNLAQGGSRRASTIPSSPPARKPFYAVNTVEGKKSSGPVKLTAVNHKRSGTRSAGCRGAVRSVAMSAVLVRWATRSIAYHHKTFLCSRRSRLLSYDLLFFPSVAS